MAGLAMWFGIVVALVLCFATAIAYAELSKLYPGAGSSYFFAEQAFLSKTRAFKLRPPGQVHHRLGQPHVLLGLSGGDGGRDRHPRRLPGRPTLAGHVQRHHQQPHVDDRLLRAVLLRRRLHRLPRRDRDHGREHGHQRDPDQRVAGLFGDRHRLPHQPPDGVAGLPRSIPDGTAITRTCWPIDKDGKPIKDEKAAAAADRDKVSSTGEGQSQAVSRWTYNADRHDARSRSTRTSPTARNRTTFQFHTSALSVVEAALASAS